MYGLPKDLDLSFFVGTTLIQLGIGEHQIAFVLHPDVGVPFLPGKSDVPTIDLATVEHHLSPGERIAWVGRSDPAKHFTRADVFLVPFTIVWGGGAIGFEIAAIVSGNVLFILFGIPFGLMGLHLFAGRFFYKAYRKRRTVYALTDRRAMTIFRGRRGEVVEAAYLQAIANVSINTDSHGRGSVEFGNASTSRTRYDPNTGLWNAGTGGGGFYDIEDPRGVANLVERLREGADG